MILSPFPSLAGSLLQVLALPQAVLAVQHALPLIEPSQQPPSVLAGSPSPPPNQLGSQTVSMNVMASTDKNFTTLMQAMESTSSTTFENNIVARRQALASARALVKRLQTPVEAMWEMSMDLPALYCSVKVAMDRQIFDILDQDGGSAKTLQQLAGNADPALINRMLRHLASMHIIQEAGPSLYAPTHHSTALRQPTVYSIVDSDYEVNSPAHMSLPRFLNATNYKNPGSATNGNWQYLKGTKETFWEYLKDHPEEQKTFTNEMIGYTSQRGSWVDVYPGQNILANATPEGLLIVDIAGGSGHDAIKFVQKFPESAGRIVVQDQPQVITTGNEAGVPSQGVKLEAHDIFKPQPIQGARVYFMHSILHDWPDQDCHQILANVKPAMKKGYSTLLINELVIPPTGAETYLTGVDIQMAAVLGSKERTYEDWESLLNSAGFKIVKAWSSLAAYEAVIEAEPA